MAYIRRPYPILTYAVVLAALLLIFIGRVSAQLVQLYRPVDFLPPFASWDSATLPYPVLVAAQFVLILIVGFYIVRLATRNLRPRRAKGKMLLVAGMVYFVFMAFRLISGLTFFAHVHWFASPLPSFFHLILAGVLLTFAHYHLRYAEDMGVARG